MSASMKKMFDTPRRSDTLTMRRHGEYATLCRDAVCLCRCAIYAYLRFTRCRLLLRCLLFDGALWRGCRHDDGAGYADTRAPPAIREDDGVYVYDDELMNVAARV